MFKIKLPKPLKAVSLHFKLPVLPALYLLLLAAK